MGARVTSYLQRQSLTARISGAVAVIVSTVLLGALLVTNRFASQAADAAVARAIGSARVQIRTILAGHERAMQERAAVVVGSPTFRSVMESRQRSALQDQVVVAANQVAALWVQAVGMDGLRLAKSDEPASDSVDVSGSSLIQRAMMGETVGALGVSRDTLIQVIALPVFGVQRQVGVLMAVRPLDAAFADSLKLATGSSVDILLYALSDSGDAQWRASTVTQTPEVRTLISTLATGAANASSAGSVPSVDTTLAIRDVLLNGTHFLATNEPLRSAGGAQVGGIIILHNRDAEFALFDPLRRSIIAVGVIGLLVSGLLAIAIARALTRPITALVEATRRAADGDYSTDFRLDATGEVAVLATAFRSMLRDLREKAAIAAFLGDPSAAAGNAAGNVPSDERPTGVAGRSGIAPGMRFAGRYDVQRVLGRGGMGEVYQAIDTELGEPVAIKVLQASFLATDARALDRFKSEIRLARRISHRNVVRTHDMGDVAGLYYITMEYIDGTSVAELIGERGALPTRVVLSIGKQLFRALEVAHDQGIIHRDIKPENLIVMADGVLKVMDFGIARHETLSDALTRADLVVGTPQYMAPEQLMGDPANVRTDLYAAGCVLYKCLVGRVPLDPTSHVSLVRTLLLTDPIRPHVVNASVPVPLSDLVMRLLAKEPEERPASAAEAYAALEQLGALE